MRQLIRKDLEENFRSYCFILCSFLLLIIFASVVTGKIQINQSFFIWICGLIMMVQITQWIISEEKQKKTFLILRSLPLSDHEIMAAKFLTFFILMGGCLNALYLISSFLGRHLQGITSPVDWWWLLWVNLIFFLIGSLNLLMGILLKPKLASTMPFAGLIGFSLLSLYIGRTQGINIPLYVSDFVFSSRWAYLAIPVVLIFIVCIYWLSVWVFHGKETHDLLG